MRCSSFSTEENKNRIGPEQNGTHAWAFGINFLFQFEPVIRNPDDKELKYFQLFLAWRWDNTKSSPIRPMLISLSGNRA